MSTISVYTPQVEEAVQDIMRVYAETDACLDRSIQILNNSPNAFQGLGADSYGQAYSILNTRYGQLKDTLQRCGQALGIANQNFSETDAQMAAQYNI